MMRYESGYTEVPHWPEILRMVNSCAIGVWVNAKRIELGLDALSIHVATTPGHEGAYHSWTAHRGEFCAVSEASPEAARAEIVRQERETEGKE